MAGSEPVFCEHCGAKLVEYKHGLSKGLVRSLVKFFQTYGRNVGGLSETKHMTYNERANFQKLRYWGLAVKANEDNPKGGDWRLTDLGYQFLCGEMALPRSVWTYRGNTVRRDDKMVLVGEVTGGWKYRPDYAREAVPHGSQLPTEPLRSER